MRMCLCIVVVEEEVKLQLHHLVPSTQAPTFPEGYTHVFMRILFLFLEKQSLVFHSEVSGASPCHHLPVSSVCAITLDATRGSQKLYNASSTFLQATITAKKYISDSRIQDYVTVYNSFYYYYYFF